MTDLHQSNRNNYLQFFFLFLLLMPLFLVNIRNSHDWGGDFAQYIHQAINITEGKPQWDNGYIFNPDNPYLAPSSYPVGFPILLAPACYFFGNNIAVFSSYITVLLICALSAMFVFFSKYFSFLISLLAVLVLAYNPWILKFKGEIVSDIPFTLFFTLSLLLYVGHDVRKKDFLRGIMLGICIGFAMLIKGIGLVLLSGILADVIFKPGQAGENRKRFNRETLTFISSVLITSVVLYLLSDKLLFPSKDDTFRFFSTLFDIKTMGSTILATSDYYVQVIQDFFRPENGRWNVFPSITRAFAIVFFILGLFIKCLKGPRFPEFVILFFLFIVFSFPNTTQGFRYLVPVSPLIVYYIITGLQSVQLPLRLRPEYIALCIGLMMLVQYKSGISEIIATQQNTLVGPQEPEAVSVFGFIRQNTPEHSKIVFIKPTVLALYTGRKSFTNHPSQSLESAGKQYGSIGYDYLLTTTDLVNNALEEYIKKNADRLTMVFENGKFRLYRKQDELQR
jgi:4-amino-4-deoxy-L-arabinose transferase-like glycosyltransferase